MTQKSVGNTINSIAAMVIRLTGAGIFVFLSWYAFRYSQYMDPAVGEFPVNVRDSMIRNLVFVLGVLLLYVGCQLLERRMADRQKVLQWSLWMILAAVTAGMGISGYRWISETVRPPEGDQLYAYVSAVSFASGDYSALLPDGYCGIYPHQLGFTAILELFFKITGSREFYVWQKFNVLCLMGIVILGEATVKEMGGKWADRMLYCLLTAGCFPMVFYTGWVYGEMLSVLCSLAVGYMMLKYAKDRKTGWLLGALPVIILGMLVRKNFLIPVIAVALTAIVWSIVQNDRKVLLFAGLAVLLPLVSYRGVYTMYEVRSGYEHSEGLPVTSWISMGLQENQGRYGWYYDYPLTIYREADGDPEIVSEVVKADIRDRLRAFKDSLGYTWNFFREKVLSEWNEPLYQSLFFTTNFREEYRPDPESIAGRITVGGAWFHRIFSICDRLQFLLYLGMLCYFCFAVKKDSSMLLHVSAVTVIGGFLFSIFWEAKARYIFPYYVIMYPQAVTGYRCLLLAVREKVSRRKTGKKKDKVVSIDKAA